MDYDVVSATKRDLDALPEAIRDSGLAATAMVLAVRLHASSTRDAAPLAKELSATLDQLGERAARANTKGSTLDGIRNS